MKPLLALILPALLISLGSQPLLAQGNNPLRVGVWNIEKMSASSKRGFPELKGSDQLDPRTETALEDMAEYIKNDLKVDALMISEIDADDPASTEAVPQSAQLNRVCDHLGSNWRYFLGRTGEDLRLGFLYNENRVRLKKLLNLKADEFPVSGKDVLDRDPFIAWITAVQGGQDQNDLLLVCLHLKSGQDRYRNNRMAAVAKLIGDITDSETREKLTLPSKSEEPEMLILGDCNDSTFKMTRFKYMFDFLAGTGFTHVKPSGTYPHTRVNGSQIDHIFSSKALLNGPLNAASFKSHTVPETERDEYRLTYSDHFPVTVELRVQPDDDFTLTEALTMADTPAGANRLAAMAGEISRRIAPESEVLEEIVDDEDEGEVIVNFEVFDDASEIESLLAPRRGAGGAPRARSLRLPGDGPEVAPGTGPARPESPAAPESGLWTAVGVIQDEMRALLTKEGGISAEERARVENLIAAEQELLRLLLKSRD